MILGDQVQRQSPVVRCRCLVEQRDPVSHLLTRQKYQNMLLVRRPDAEAVQLQVVGEQEFQVLECQERATRRVAQPSGHPVPSPSRSLTLSGWLASFRTSRLSSSSLNRSSSSRLTFSAGPSGLSRRAACLSKIHPLVSLQALVSAQDDVQVPSRRHFQLLPKLRVDLVAGQLHGGTSWA